MGIGAGRGGGGGGRLLVWLELGAQDSDQGAALLLMASVILDHFQPQLLYHKQMRMAPELGGGDSGVIMKSPTDP